MPITQLQILPPLAVARFGSAETPLDAYELVPDPNNPLAYREIRAAESLEVDSATGAIARSYTPDRIQFKDDRCRVRPVAPFLEVFATTADGKFQPLDLELLKQEGLDATAVCWSLQVANLKVYRQTLDADDKVIATVSRFNDHEEHPLQGKCAHFLKDKFIPFGRVRYIRPTAQFPEIRLRFTPATGKVYGSHTERFELDENKLKTDPVFSGHEDRIVYNTAVGKWRGFQSDVSSKTLTNPSDIYQGYWPDPTKLPISWGYLDDVCDGVITVELALKDGSKLSTHAWISSCMPAFAPDSLPVRTVADDLEQLLHGPDLSDSEVSVHAAAEIVRRSLETLRHMNTLVMNGNIVEGRTNVAHTLGTQDTNDFGRLYAPIVAASLVDNLAVRTLHERIYTALMSGAAPWFSEVIRKPEEIGDLSDKARRKMPAMLRGADGRALALTRRQISTLTKAAMKGPFDPPNRPASSTGGPTK